MALKLLQVSLFSIMLLLAKNGNSQFVVIPEVQANGVVMKQQLWSLMINNLSGAARKITVSVSVTDRLSSQVLVETNSGLIIINPGAKRLTYQDQAPLSYGIAAMGFSADRQLNQPLPVGEYLVCYRLFDLENKNQLLASECVKIIAEPLSPPQLIQPENKTTITQPRPVLTWTPPAPVYMFTALSYDIIVSPMYEKQSPEEALQRNIPVMTTQSFNNSVLYPSSYTNLQPGKTYAWQVLAKDAGRAGGKSEVWTFTVMPDSVVRIISAAPYTKLNKENTSTSVIHQGILKMEYLNASADSTVEVKFYRLTEKNARGKGSVSFSLKVKPGQNFLEYNLNGKLKLQEGMLYEARLSNSNKEEWKMKFVAQNYF